MNSSSTGNIGINLHMLLYDKKMSKSELAKKTGASLQMISHIVLGERVPSLPMILKISEALGVTVDDLMKGGNV